MVDRIRSSARREEVCQPSDEPVEPDAADAEEPDEPEEPAEADPVEDPVEDSVEDSEEEEEEEGLGEEELDLPRESLT